jgi:hypothetical protein
MRHTKTDYFFNVLAFFALPYFVMFDAIYAIYKKRDHMLLSCSDSMFFLAIVSAICQIAIAISIYHLIF